MALLTEPVPSEVYGRCDPCLRARTWDRSTEARTGPGPLYPRNGKRPPTIQRACDDTSTGPHEDPLTASSGRPSDEGVTGHSPGV